MVPVPLKDYISGKLRRSLIVLWAVVGAILLIACVNLSNLQLALFLGAFQGVCDAGRAGCEPGTHRTTTAYREPGAGGIRRGCWTDAGMDPGFVVCAPGRDCAAAAEHAGTSTAPPWVGLLLIAVFAAMVFGLVPGLRIASGNLQESLKDAGPGASASRKHELLRAVLVVSEVALACMLLVGAGLLLRSFMRVLDVDLGFQPDRAAAIKITYDDNVPGDKTGALAAQRRSVIFQQILARVGSLPGIEAAGMVDYLPLGQNRAWGTPIPQGRNRSDFKNIAGPLVYVISPGYMRAMGTRMRGRDISWDDGPNSEQVVLINEAMARFFWPNEDAVGKILGDGVSNKNNLRVIGVVGDVHEENVDGEAGWQIYYSMTQSSPSGAELVVRTTLPPASLANSVLTTLREMNPKQPGCRVPSRDPTAGESRRLRQAILYAARRLICNPGVAFSCAGNLWRHFLLCDTPDAGDWHPHGPGRKCVGIVQRQVLAGTLRLAVIGVVLGAAVSVVAARLMASLLFATSPWDAVTYISMAIALLAVAGISGFIPAFRASRINPTVALRAN